MATGTTRQQLAKGTLQLEEKPKGRFLAFFLSLLILAGLGLLFTVIVIMPKTRDEPEVIVEVVVPEVQAAPQMQKLNALKSFEKSFSMPTQSAFSRMMKASSRPIQAPSALLEQYEIDDKPLGFGDADLGGELDDEESIASSEVKSGTSFFGVRTTAKKIVYLVDLSDGAKPMRQQIEDELVRSIESLSAEVKYAVIGYGPVPWRVGRGTAQPKPTDVPQKNSYVVTYQGGKAVYVKDPRTQRYVFNGLPTSRSAGKWSGWTPDAANAVKKELSGDLSLGGHNWFNALTMAHNLDPKPEAIYFVVASGAGVPVDFSRIAAYNRDQGNPAILGVLLETARGVRELHALSLSSGGQTRIVLEGGKRTIPAQKFLENPSNEMRFLGEFDLWLQWEKEREKLGMK